ncbi:MAG: hypothetical protein WCY88_17070 [Spongiibacteraceae bacterium]
MDNLNDKGSAVRIEIDQQLLTRILANRSVSASDIRCLDDASKKQLWRICLKACTESH